MLILDGFESHVSPKIIDFAIEHKILLCLLPSHTSHLTQPLDVGMFGPLQRRYRQELGRREQEGLEEVTKQDFLSILAVAREEAYTEDNIQTAYRSSGIEPFSVTTLVRHVNPDYEKTPPPPDRDVLKMKTPTKHDDVDRIISGIYATDTSPVKNRGVYLLAKGLKQALHGFSILKDQAESHRKSRRSKPRRAQRVETREGLLVTPDLGREIRRNDLIRQSMIDKKQRHREAKEARLKHLHEHGQCLNNKRCPKKRLMILPVAWRPRDASEVSIDSHEDTLDD